MTFAMRMTVGDFFLSYLLAGVAGALVYLQNAAANPLNCALAVLLAVVRTYAVYVIVRALVPFVLHLSFAHMMRLKLSFYLWLTSLVAAIALGGVPSLPLTLVLASMALTTRFFQHGRLAHLTLAFARAGGAFGLSAFGALAPAAALFLLWFMAHRMLFVPNRTYWQDPPHPGVVEFFANPLIRSRMKWVLSGCFFGCVGLAYCFVRQGPWWGGAGMDGTAFLLLTAIVPLIVELNMVDRASNKLRNISFCGPVYIVVALLSAVFWLKPLLLPSLIGLELRLGPELLSAASVFYAFNIMLAGVVTLADIRCRDFREEGVARADRLRGVMRAVYAVVSLVPPAVVGCVALLSLR